MALGGARPGAGRPKGTPNKTTERLRTFFADLLDENIEQMREDLAALEPYQRLTILERLAKFVLPAKVDLGVEFDQPVKFVVKVQDAPKPKVEE